MPSSITIYVQCVIQHPLIGDLLHNYTRPSPSTWTWFGPPLALNLQQTTKSIRSIIYCLRASAFSRQLSAVRQQCQERAKGLRKFPSPAITPSTTTCQLALSLQAF